MATSEFTGSLFDIQNYVDSNNNPYPQLGHLLPSDAQIYELDLSTRKVTFPRGHFDHSLEKDIKQKSVRYDHNADIIYFKCDRYFDNIDLTTTVCIIQYVNAHGDAGLFWVPFYDVDHYDTTVDAATGNTIPVPKILIPWSLGGLATLYSGDIKFSIRFYKMKANGVDFLYNMSTTPQTMYIAEGMDLSQEDLEQFMLDADTVSQIYNAVNAAKNEASTYWEEA